MFRRVGGTTFFQRKVGKTLIVFKKILNIRLGKMTSRKTKGEDMIETKDAVNNLRVGLPGLPGTLPPKAEKTTNERSGPTTGNTAGSMNEHFALSGKQPTSSEPPQLQFLTARELLRQYRDMKEPLIEGLLRREEVMNIVAAPKTGKSWLVMQLALALVTGKQWCGRECTMSRVLLVDNELHRETLSCRLHRVATAMGISDDDELLDGLTILSQRGAATDIRLLKSQLDKHSDPKFDIIIIDALYKALPKDVDENSNGQITSIYNLLDNYALTTGAAIVLVHHTSKGNQSNKSVTDIGSGAGAQSRSPDTHLTLRQHSAEGVVSAFCCVRSFSPVEPFCLRRDENNLWSLAPEHDPNDMAGKDAVPAGQTAKRLMTVEDVAATVEANLQKLALPMGKTPLVEAIRDNIGTSKAKATSALEVLCGKGVLEVRNGDPKKNQQAMKCYYPGPGYAAASPACV